MLVAGPVVAEVSRGAGGRQMPDRCAPTTSIPIRNFRATEPAARSRNAGDQGERVVALSVSPLGARDRLLRLLPRFAGRGVGHRLRRDGRLAANDRVPGSALGVLRPRGRVPLAVRRGLRALLGLLRGPQRRLRRLVGLDPLAPRSGLELGGADDLRLRVGTHRGELRLQLLGVAEHRDHLARAFQISRQSSGQHAQAARGQGRLPQRPSASLLAAWTTPERARMTQR